MTLNKFYRCLLLCYGCLFLYLSFVNNSTARPMSQQKMLSMQFNDTPIQVILQALANHQSLNLIVDDSVKGNYTLRLEHITWRQAFDMLVKLAMLDIEIKNNIMIVLPLEEKRAREKRDIQAQLENDQQKPILTLIQKTYYTSAEKIAAILQNSGGTLLSESGKVMADPRTDTLIIRDIADSLEKISQLISAIDRPQQQVLLAAYIVSMNSDHMRQLGIAWNMSDLSVKNGLRFNDFNVSLPVTNPSLIAGGQLIKKNGRILSLELSALEAENNIEIIANPHLLTLDRQTASIKQGTEIPYETTGSSEKFTTIEFKDAVLGLEVTPKILPEGRVELALVITQNSPGQVLKKGDGGEVLTIDTREIKTQVVVNHQETLALGGIFQYTTTKQVESVPFLGKIPFLGALFRRDSYKQAKRELVIFITPEIISI